MRPKSLILVAMALGCGLVAAIGINQVLARKPEVVVQEIETKKILVAVTDIGVGEPFTDVSTRLEDWPTDKVPEDAIASLEEVQDKSAGGTIFKGEPIRKGRLSDGASAVNFIPEGFRAIPVRVDSSSGGANMILPGNRVDVMVYLRQNLQQGIKESGVRTILEDVKVFAVNDVFRSEQGTGEKTIAAKTISLLVSPDQAQKLALAEELGKIRLVMRNLSDSEASRASGADVSDLFGMGEKNSRDEELGKQATSEPTPTPVAAAPPSEENKPKGLLESLKEAIKNHANSPEAAALARPALPPPPFRMTVIEGTESRILEFNEADTTAMTGWSGHAASNATAGDAVRPAFGGVPLSPTPPPTEQPQQTPHAPPPAPEALEDADSTT